MNAKILIIEDDQLLNEMIVYQLEGMGYEASGVNSLSSAKKHLEQYEVNLILSDMRLPDGDCITALPELMESYPVIVLTAYGTVQNAVAAIQAGAAHYLTKPISPDELKITVDRVLKMAMLEADQLFYKSRLKEKNSKLSFIIGHSTALNTTKEQIKAVAPSDMTVLITGESGSGKELVARAIHEQSQYADKHFVAVDCCTLQENLFEAELFGYENTQKKGLIEGAYGGTLFLDEVGDIPLTTQVKLLQVLETSHFRRMDGTKDISSKVRIIAATNRDLKAMSDKGEFRADLYYRLNVFTLQNPPLRERRDDIPFLVKHFINHHDFSMRIKKTITQEAMRKLIAYDWPGNVRELKNMLERAIILSQKTKNIRSEHLSLGATEQKNANFQLDIQQKTEPTLEEIEACYLNTLMKKHDGHRVTIAKIMGISERQVYRLIKKHTIDEQNV